MCPDQLRTEMLHFKNRPQWGTFSVTKQESQLRLAFGLLDRDGRVRDEVQGWLDGVDLLALACEASIPGFINSSVIFVVIYKTTASAGLGIAGIQ